MRRRTCCCVVEEQSSLCQDSAAWAATLCHLSPRFPCGKTTSDPSQQSCPPRGRYRFMTGTIRKAVLPVGGLGTRFLPATKAITNDMLPVVDQPLIQYGVEAARQAGIQELTLSHTPRNATT